MKAKATTVLTWNWCFGGGYIFYLCHSVQLSHRDCTIDTPNPWLTMFQTASLPALWWLGHQLDANHQKFAKVGKSYLHSHSQFSFRGQIPRSRRELTREMRGKESQKMGGELFSIKVDKDLMTKFESRAWWSICRKWNTQLAYSQTWNLSKILHRRIFRLTILHRQFHLISTVLVRNDTKN